MLDRKKLTTTYRRIYIADGVSVLVSLLWSRLHVMLRKEAVTNRTVCSAGPVPGEEPLPGAISDLLSGHYTI
jgi:hypothetical protein